MAQTITPTASLPRRTGPTLLIVAGVVLFGTGVWMFVSGLVSTVETVRDSIETATDVTSGLEAVAAVPGEVSTRLEPDQYQVVAIGNGLTSTRLNPAGVNEHVVYAVPFDKPDIAVIGPDGPVVVRSPTIDQLVDGPSGDLVAIGEFTAETGASYTLTANGSGAPVARVGIDVRPDIGAMIRESVVDIGKLVLGGFVGFFGVCILVSGIVWRIIRRHGRGLALGTPGVTSQTGAQ